jgi:hypothetical protein
MMIIRIPVLLVCDQQPSFNSVGPEQNSVSPLSLLANYSLDHRLLVIRTVRSDVHLAYLETSMSRALIQL